MLLLLLLLLLLLFLCCCCYSPEPTYPTDNPPKPLLPLPLPPIYQPFLAAAELKPQLAASLLVSLPTLA
jgi:hypothetical protein